MGFHALGLGFINKKTIENGNGTKIRARQALRQWDLCSGTMGFSHNLGWEMGIGSPLQDPHISTYILKGQKMPPPPPPPAMWNTSSQDEGHHCSHAHFQNPA